MKSKELDPGAAGTATRVVQACDQASALSSDHADNFPDVFATAGIGSKSSRRMRRARSGGESTTARSSITGAVGRSGETPA